MTWGKADESNESGSKRADRSARRGQRALAALNQPSVGGPDASASAPSFS
ncbi:hypothetical protein AWB68_02097 [Caballeronia choica]|uniref:Uncharacterized protein n=1 Tax=Caballeronia choica TaxID=326476 RepID=A0A158HKL7_9BURK|nr:hypothetical protein AWB68_02097 [Caballeronia choica]